jgi:flagellar biosynthesis protein FliQ
LSAIFSSTIEVQQAEEPASFVPKILHNFASIIAAEFIVK